MHCIPASLLGWHRPVANFCEWAGVSFRGRDRAAEPPLPLLPLGDTAMPPQPRAEPTAAPIAASPSPGAPCPRPARPVPWEATGWPYLGDGGAHSPSPSRALPAAGAELAAGDRRHPRAAAPPKSPCRDQCALWGRRGGWRGRAALKRAGVTAAALGQGREHSEHRMKI